MVDKQNQTNQENQNKIKQNLKLPFIWLYSNTVLKLLGTNTENNEVPHVKQCHHTLFIQKHEFLRVWSKELLHVF